MFWSSSTVTVMDLAAAMSAYGIFLFHVKDAIGLVFRPVFIRLVIATNQRADHTESPTWTSAVMFQKGSGT